jgi:DNA-binding GntR family transcriptional regulator
MTAATSGAKLGPRYAQVSDTLQQRIRAGEYAVGALLPTELDLCQEFGISRHTVREALRRLSEAGLVQRRQGSGSQVISSSPKGGYVHAMRSLNELFQYATDTHLRVDRISEGVPSAPLGAVLGNQAGQTWITLEGLRLDAAGRQPICWSTVLINQAFAGIVADFATLNVAADLGGAGGAALSGWRGTIDARFGQRPSGGSVLVFHAVAERGPDPRLTASRMLGGRVRALQNLCRVFAQGGQAQVWDARLDRIFDRIADMGITTRLV